MLDYPPLCAAIQAMPLRGIFKYDTSTKNDSSRVYILLESLICEIW